MFPLSVLSFRSLCHNLSLNQNESLKADTASNAVFGTSLEKYFRVCVKAKKRHEVDVLAEVTKILLYLLFSYGSVLLRFVSNAFLL